VHCVALIGGLFGFHALGRGLRGHKTLHHAVVPMLVLDGVSVIRVGLLEEFFEVVCGRSCLMLAIASGHNGTHHAGSASFFVGAAVVVGRG
jgi:hypothetical protein